LEYGQWFGEIAGGAYGPLFLSIDKSQRLMRGSLIADDRKPNGGPFIAAFTVESASGGTLRARLHDFIFFHNDKPIDYAIATMTGGVLSQSGQLVLSVNGDAASGTWETDKGFKGTLNLRRLHNLAPKPVEKVFSWEEFRKEAGDSSCSPQGAFFRGQDSAKYAMRTCFHRQNNWDLYRYSREVLPELFQFLGAYNNTRYRVTDDEDFGAALYLAQHHGFPTPLMDWSVSPFVGAFFAYETTAKDQKDPVRVYRFDAEKWVKDQPLLSTGGILSPHLVIRPMVLPIAGNRRAIAQDGRSLFCNVDCLGELNILQPYFHHYDVAIEDRQKALSELSMMGIHRMKLFPDKDNVCRVLRARYFEG